MNDSIHATNWASLVNDMLKWETIEPGIRRSYFYVDMANRLIRLNGNLGPAFLFRGLNITTPGTYQIKVNWSYTLGAVYCRIDNELHTFPTDKTLNFFIPAGQHKIYIEADNITKLSENKGYIVSVKSLNEPVPAAVKGVVVH